MKANWSDKYLNNPDEIMKPELIKAIHDSIILFTKLDCLYPPVNSILEKMLDKHRGYEIE